MKKCCLLFCLVTSFLIFSPPLVQNMDAEAGIIRKGLKKAGKWAVKKAAKSAWQSGKTAAGAAAAPHILDGLGMKKESAGIREMQRIKKEQYSKMLDKGKKIYNIYKQSR